MSNILTITDPNDNAGTRYQYMVSGWLLLRRRLPAEDRWMDDDIDEPWWEPMLTLPPGGPILDHWRAHARGVDEQEYAMQARYSASHVAAYTPDGREVCYDRGGLAVQPRNGNYLIRVRDLREARLAYHGKL